MWVIRIPADPDPLSTQPLFARMSSPKNGLELLSAARGTSHQSTRTSAQISLVLLGSSRPHSHPNQSGCYRTTPRAPRAPPFLGHGPATLRHAGEARKPPRPSPTVIIHVVCESPVQVQTSLQAKFGGKRKKRHFPSWGLCGSVSLLPPLQPAGAENSRLVRGGQLPLRSLPAAHGQRLMARGPRFGKGAEAY